MSAEAEARQARRQWRRDLKTLLLSIIPGLGHLGARHPLTGAALFSLFILFANMVVLGRILLGDPRLSDWLIRVFTPAAALVWIIGLAHAWRIGFGRDRPRLRERRRELLRGGVLAYLRDQLPLARRKLLRAIRYDYDWEDPALLFHLGVVELRLAQHADEEGNRRLAQAKRKAAARAFDRCLIRAPESPWASEILEECEQANIKAPRRARAIDLTKSEG